MSDEDSYVIRGEWTGTEYVVEFGGGAAELRRRIPGHWYYAERGELVTVFAATEWFWWVNFWAHWHVRRVERRAWKIYQLSEGGRR